MSGEHTRAVASKLSIAAHYQLQADLAQIHAQRLATWSSPRPRSVKLEELARLDEAEALIKEQA